MYVERLNINYFSRQQTRPLTGLVEITEEFYCQNHASTWLTASLQLVDMEHQIAEAGLFNEVPLGIPRQNRSLLCDVCLPLGIPIYNRSPIFHAYPQPNDSMADQFPRTSILFPNGNPNTSVTPWTSLTWQIPSDPMLDTTANLNEDWLVKKVCDLTDKHCTLIAWIIAYGINNWFSCQDLNVADCTTQQQDSLPTQFSPPTTMLHPMS